MMGTLREWLASVVTVALLLALAQTLIPEGTVRRIGSFAGGLILLLTLLQPLSGGDPIRLETEFESCRQEIEDRRQELQQAGDRALAAIIEEQTAAYISDKAAALGTPVQVRVETEMGADGVTVPVSAQLKGAYSEALSVYMEQELGIPRERQVWYEN